jgi:DNA-binding GntR family transcriptional regulator
MGEEIDLEGPDYLYEQIAQIIRARIADGTYPPRRRIPSEAELSQMFGVSRPTARHALQLLIDEGLVVPRVGRGTYVKEPDQGSS